MRKAPPNPEDASQTLTTGAQQVIADAQQLARACGNPSLESVHLLLGALQIEPPDAQLQALLQISALKAEEVRLYAQSALESAANPTEELQQMGESARSALRLAGKEARRSDCALVDVSHLFIACFRPQNASELAEVLAPLSVSADQLSVHLRGLSRGAAATKIADESPLAQLTEHGERALEVAEKAMRANFCGRISTLHLLIGVLENPDGDAVAALKTLMIDVEALRQRVGVAAVSDGEIAGPNRLFTPAAKRALDRAKAAAREGGRSHIGSADLLMGLLPQPLLLIERAQFGAHPDDPAAALLRDVDADLVRAIFNPRQAATPLVTPVVVRPKPSSAVRSFAVCCGVEFALCLALGKLEALPRSTVGGIFGLILAIMLGLLIGSGLAACGMLLFSKDDGRKNAWGSGFFGALVGVMAGMAVAGVFR